MIYTINVTEEHGHSPTVPPHTTRGRHHQTTRLLLGHLVIHLSLITSSFYQCFVLLRFQDQQICEITKIWNKRAL